jgi:hypothetical protein
MHGHDVSEGDGAGKWKCSRDETGNVEVLTIYLHPLSSASIGHPLAQLALVNVVL